MESFWQDPEAWQLIGAAFGAFASIAAFMKWVWPLLRQGYRNIMGHVAIEGKLDALTTKIEYLVEETQANGGTSLKDALNRIEFNVELINERVRARMLDSEDMVFEADEEGNVVWANRTVLRIVQRMPNEIMGRGWVNIIAPSMREEVVQEWNQAVSQDREFEKEIMWRTPDGDEFPVYLRSYRMTDRNGETLGYFGTVKLL